MNSSSPPSGPPSPEGPASLPPRAWYIILGGFAITVLGFVLMAGGGSDDPHVFNPDIFSFRRITLAPVLVLLGYVVGIIGILWRSPRR